VRSPFCKQQQIALVQHIYNNISSLLLYSRAITRFKFCYPNKEYYKNEILVNLFFQICPARDITDVQVALAEKCLPTSALDVFN